MANLINGTWECEGCGRLHSDEEEAEDCSCDDYDGDYDPNGVYEDTYW